MYWGGQYKGLEEIIREQKEGVAHVVSEDPTQLLTISTIFGFLLIAKSLILSLLYKQS